MEMKDQTMVNFDFDNETDKIMDIVRKLMNTYNNEPTYDNLQQIINFIFESYSNYCVERIAKRKKNRKMQHFIHDFGFDTQLFLVSALNICEKHITYKIIMQLININDYNYVDLPKIFSTKKIYLKILKKQLVKLTHIPHDMYTKKMCAIGAINNPSQYVRIPNEFIDDKFNLYVVKRNPDIFQFVKINFRTEKLAKKAIKRCGTNYVCLPNYMKTYKFAFVALLNTPLAIQYVEPKHHAKLLAKICQKYPIWFDSLISFNFLHRFLTEKVLLQMVKKNFSLIEIIPKKLMTEKLQKILDESMPFK